MVAMPVNNLLQIAPRLVQITTDQYHEMLRSGILPENSTIELLDGMLIRKDRSKKGADPESIGEEHRWCVEQLHDINSQLKSLGYFMQTQQPLALGDVHEPEPDGSIIRGSNADYRHRKPNGADALCVIEVADSSLDYDRTSKLQTYAHVGIPQYVIVNLVDRQIECHTRPDAKLDAYKQTEIVQAGGIVQLVFDGSVRATVAAEDLLP